MRNLFTTWYDCGNAERQKELDHCLRMNVESRLFDEIHLYVDDETKLPEWTEQKVNLVTGVSGKPKYSDFILLINSVFLTLPSDSTNIIANTDIIFDETIKLADNMPDDTCYALSRWEMETFDTKLHYQVQVYGDSQDVWIFKGKIKPMEWTDFPIATRGCDNRIAHEIQKAGYKITNPSKSIKTWHLHISNVRDYIPAQGYAVPEPYLNVPVVTL